MSGIIQGLLASLVGGAKYKLYAWGRNNQGQLGDDSIISRSSPVQIGSDTDWGERAGGGDYNSAFIKGDKSLWSWGDSYRGSVGDGEQVDRSSPVQIGALLDWEGVKVGDRNASAVRSNGTMWTWGLSLWGKLGQNDQVSRSSPTQVGALTTWAQVGGGRNHCIALKSDGTVWTWGRNTSGQLGDLSTTFRSSPVQVGVATDWSFVAGGGAHNLAIKTNGTIWAWGDNYAGQCGKTGGSGVDISSPVQVGYASDWSFVNAGGYSSFATTSSGALYSWGRNGNGELGLNNLTNRSVTTQIGALTTWVTSYGISSGAKHSLATTTDDNIWVWGNNYHGQLGTNDRTYRSSPVQIGIFAHDWAFAFAGHYHSFATDKS